FVLPHTREELRFVFSKFGRGTLIARSRNLYVLSDYLIPNNLNVLSREETQDVILEFSDTEYYYDESLGSQSGTATNIVMQRDLEYIPAFLNAVSILM
ncbi:TPA_asm: PBSX family phage terminase large subunit, partial [Salmonella enterica]|nr:PBSX family phage terminase large subunit [Salmonella enterica]